MLFNIVLFILAFFLIWFGSGLIVSSVDKFSHLLKISSFSISFFVLGFLTTIPEIAVGLDSLFSKQPEIFVGDLIGGTMVIFILIIPILAIIGNGISLRHNLSNKNLLFSLFVILAPALLISDGKVTIFEGILLILLYVILFYSIEKKQSIIEDVVKNLTSHRDKLTSSFLKVSVGIIIVVFSSFFIVQKTIEFSKFFNISPFIIGLVILAIGTNLPELLIALRSLKEKKKDIAFGDYIGSAVANSAIFGTLTIINGGDVIVSNHFLQYFIFIIIGLSLFYFFLRSKNDISRNEGMILVLLYFIFILFELKNNFL